MCRCFADMCVCVLYACPEPANARGMCKILWNWNYI